MRNHDLLTSMAALVVSLMVASCASSNAPSGWLPDADHAAPGVYGGWMTVRIGQEEIMGELIAATDDTVYVADSVLHAFAAADVLKARLVAYEVSGLGGYVILGMVSTVSHGVVLLITAPLWLIGGSWAAISRSYDPIIDYPGEPLKRFVPFARFPQGLPPELDRSTIRMKRTR